MDKALVDLTIGGRQYRVSATADAATLYHLAQVVDDKLQGLPQAQRTHPHALVLVALALAHEVEEQRSARKALAEAYSTRLALMLDRIDAVLGAVDEDAQPLGATSQPPGRGLALETKPSDI